jgi:hypothetical protein
MTDLDDDDVTSLDDISAQIKQVKDSIPSIWPLLFLAWLFLTPTTTWVTLNKAWYSLTTSVSYDNVYMTKQPTNCDWSHAPLGNKSCHYEKHVDITLTGTQNATGKHMVSYDNGKTWAADMGSVPAAPRVDIYFEKIEEDQ